MSHMALFNMTQHHGPHDPSPWSLLWAHQRSWKSSSLRDCSLLGDSEMPLPSHLTYLTIAALQLLLKRWKAHLDSLIQTQLFQDHSMLFTFNRSNQGFACFPCTFTSSTLQVLELENGCIHYMSNTCYKDVKQPQLRIFLWNSPLGPSCPLLGTLTEVTG